MQTVSKYTRLCVLICALVGASNALTLYNDNATSQEFPGFHYATIGLYPDVPTIANVTVIKGEHLDKCSFNDKISPDQIRGRILVSEKYLYGETVFSECVIDVYAYGIYFAKLAQDAGAVGVISELSDYEKDYIDGKIAGFNNKIKIPFVISTKSEMNALLAQINNSSVIEIPAIKSKDKHLLESTKNVWHGLIIFNSILYAILSLALGYLVILEVYLLRVFRDFKHHKSILIKTAAFTDAVFAFIWLVTDPFSFKLTKFPSVPFIYIFLSLTCIIYCMILRIWAKATGTKRSSRLLRFVKRGVHGSVLICLLLTVLASIFWTNLTLFWIYTAWDILMLVVCTVGYIYFGKNIVTILYKSGSQNSRGTGLSARIILFIAHFVVIGIVGIIINEARVMGAVITFVICMLFIGFSLIFTFLLLFVKARTKEGARQSTGSGTGSNTSHSGSGSNKIVTSESMANLTHSHSHSQTSSATEELPESKSTPNVSAV